MYVDVIVVIVDVIVDVDVIVIGSLVGRLHSAESLGNTMGAERESFPQPSPKNLSHSLKSFPAPNRQVLLGVRARIGCAHYLKFPI